MAGKTDGAAVTNTTPGSCVSVPCAATRKITYQINAPSVTLPYAVAINGKVLDKFKDRALGTKCDGKPNIVVHAAPGDKVALYLNSDANPDFREEAVYTVTVGENDIAVTITEKSGKHADADTPVFKETRTVKDKKGVEKKTDHYTAPLTGDIWMKISHKYTAAEARERIPASTRNEIRDAVLKFYDGSLSSTSPNNTATLSAVGDNPAKTVTIRIGPGAAQNPLTHITSFNLHSDGLPRVHPHGFVALFEAAFDAGVANVTLTSTWRPIKGSIAHRAGLGLDVNYLDNVQLNRQELRGNGPDADNVSEEEKKRFKEKEAAEAEAKIAKAKLEKLEAEQKLLHALEKSSPTKVDPSRKVELEKEISDAKDNVKTTSNKAIQAKLAWNKERDNNEPAKVKGYRTSLSRCLCVRQLYDPWYMDDNTQDGVVATPNQQRSSNETLHAHHLHITVHEPKIR